MKKDIYIIKNTINERVYIGQAVNAANRWIQHISDSKCKQKTVISRAMAKYGIDKFYYQIIEYQIENFDERERYWIEFYNSIVPNGYNVSIGGQGVGNGLNHPNASIKEQEIIDCIVEDIKNSKLSFEKIADKYDCNTSLISEINRGKSYYDSSLNYPLRLSRKEKETVKQLIYSLQYEFDKSILQISKEYEVEKSVVHDINNGKLHRIDGKKYPLRQGRVFSNIDIYVPEVIKLLKDNSLQQKEIARKFNVSTSWVSSINKGRIYRQPNEEYPIRQNYQCSNGGRKSFSPNEIREIEDLLENHLDVSIRKISLMYETSVNTIQNINSGSIIKFRQNHNKYPLRKTTPVSTIRA